MTTLAELIARWNTDEGKPYKGKLIDWDAYKKDPTNIGCMCAQGQVLHLVGGWTAERLEYITQTSADDEVAKLLNISRTHAVLLRHINDNADGAPAVVLADPGAVLGDQWSKLLDFWWYLDGLTAEQWAATRDAARAAARDAAGDEAWDAAGDEAGASNEIQGAAVLRQRGIPLFFLPAFGFADPDDIPARPASYGVQP